MIARENLQDLYPLSPMQEGMLFHHLAQPRSQAYVEQISYRFRGAFDVHAFERAWEDMLRRHDVLRTVFVYDKTARPLQMVLKQATLEFRVEQGGDADAYRVADRARGFDLVRELPTRVALFIHDRHVEVIWTFHHIILDGWSVALLMADLLRHYEARVAGRALALPPPPPFSRYIQWLGQRDETASRQYWARMLEGFETTTSIPSSMPGPRDGDYRPARFDFAFDGQETAALERCARDAQVTLGTLVQALWALLLSRHQPWDSQRRNHDVLFGVVVSGRPPSVPGIEETIGLLTNTIPLRVTFDEGESVASILERLQRTAAESHEHAFLPLADIQTRPGMLDHVLVFENYPREAIAAPSVESVTSFEQTPYDFNVVIAPGEQLHVSFYVNAARHSQAQCTRLFEQLRAGAHAFAANIDTPAGAIDILPSSEHAQLAELATERGRYTPDPSATILSLIEGHAEERPDALALISGNERFTYAEVRTRARTIATNLLASGIRPGDRVAVVLDRDQHLPIVFLAVLQTGAVYVPIDPGLPQDRQQFAITDSGCRSVWSAAAAAAAFGSSSREPAKAAAAAAALHIVPRVVPNDVAYIIYTSGSTGLPKGVAIAHGGIVNLMAHLREVVPVTPDDRVVHFSSPSFDASLWEICAAWCHGAALVIASRADVADPARFGALLKRHQCTIAILPPSYISVADPDDLAVLKTIVSGGEAANPASVRALSARVRFVNAYGPTEASIQSTTYVVDPERPLGNSIPVGRPIPNVEALILDPSNRLAPIGVAGELCLAGAGVGVGYVDRPELTAQKFPPHPFREGARMYRTGDVVRWLDDGMLEFIGRVDHQVKVRGYRIELGEIESALLAQPGVSEAAAVVRGDQIVAFVAPDTVDATALRAAIARTLPDYMMPAHLVLLGQLPHTSAGKVNRRALPDVHVDAPPDDAPRDQMEAELAAIFRSVLAIPAAGIHDDFFALGGHSLKAIRLAAKIRKELGRSIELADLFAYPTIASLATFLRGRPLQQAQAIPRLPDAPHYPVSHAQHRLWLLEQIGRGAAAYNISGAFEVDGNLNADALDRALRALIERHESLRTTFTIVDGELRQRVHPEPRFDRYDDYEAARLTPFDLANGPLIRTVRTPHRFAIVLHHIIADGWSMPILGRELSALYASATLPPLRMQLRDVSAWQNAQVTENARDHWRRVLAPPLPSAELPADRPRPSQRTFRGAELKFAFDDSFADALQALARRNTTLFTLFAAAVQALLHRYTGERDVMAGYPSAGREHPDLEAQVGFFVNTLPLRTTVDPERGFTVLLDRVQRFMAEAAAHQQYPFDRMVEDAGVAGDSARNPLFDVMVAFDQPELDVLSFPGVVLRPVIAEARTSKFDLLFAFSRKGGAIEYATDLFDASTIERMHEHLLSLLRAVVAQPELPLSRLPLLTPEELAVIARAEGKAVWTDNGDTLVSRFERAAAAAPDRVAVVCGEDRLTYAELDARAEIIARDVTPGTIAGITLPRSAEAIAAMVGVLKAGAAYVAIDPALPEARRASMLDTCRQFEAADASERRGVRSSDPAYVIFTSGSTGQPKGVVVEHRQAVALIDAFATLAPEHRHGPATTLCGFGFDVSVWEIFSALCNGATLHVLTNDVAADPRRLSAYFAEHQIATAYIPPALLDDVELPVLKRLLIGVEPIAMRTVRRHQRANPALRIINGYGPTETTVCATFHVCDDTLPDDARIPIGIAAPGYRVYLLDDAMQRVPLGVTGEIWIGGAGVSRGYLGDPALTAARFIADPFSDDPGARLYRTGDLARRLPDGALLYLRRRDAQVKFRGYRIEPGEIETALLTCAGVAEAFVLVEGDRLLAYTGGNATDTTALRDALKQRLPDYMIPSAIVTLPALPRTANGKIDRAALPAAEAAPAGSAPKTPAEELLAGIWRDVLGVTAVDSDASFFDIGGHSLLATRLIGRVHDIFGVDVSLHDFFETPTIRALAARLERGERTVLPPIVRRGHDGPARPSFAQQRLWFLEQLEPGPTYNVPIVLSLQGPLDRDRLEASLNSVIARHEILRTRFISVDGIPRQEIAPQLHAMFTRAQFSRPFDLSQLPLLRAELVQVAEDEHTLLLCVHHIIIDGWSVSVLLRDVATAYNNTAAEPLAIQYADFAEWQPLHEEQLEYWSRQLDGIPPLLALPTDVPRRADRLRTARVERFTLTADVDRLSRTHGATPFMTFIAALSVLLARYSGQDDIVIGTPIANRTRPELEPLIGFFANTLALRTRLDDDPAFAELLRRVRRTALDAYAHQDVPFERVVDRIQPERTLGHTPIFQILFVLQNAPLNSTLIEGLEVTALEQPSMTAKFDLTIAVEAREGQWTGVIEYDADLFEAATIARFASHFDALLHAIAEDPSTRVSRLALPTSPVAATAPPAHFGDGTVLPLFDAQVQRTPDAIAVEHGAATLTYRQLDERAGQLAQYLRGKGAAPNVPVAFRLERSLDLAVTLLAIVKAGAGCLPLDPSYPEERLSFMLADSGAPVVITREFLNEFRSAPAPDAFSAKPNADDLLYLLYTSGSTGKPKGVLVPHRVIANLVAWGLDTDFAAPARTLQFTPASFDVSFQEYFTCWCTGGALVMIDDERRRDSEALLAFLADHRIERLFLPFVALQGLAEAAELVDDERLPHTLRQVITAGEQLRTTAALASLFTRLPHCELHNHYGPTETHVVTAHRLEGDPQTWPLLPPIGRPISQTRAIVVDEHLQPVPQGVPGELLIGGAVLSSGYANRPDLTAERFIASTFGERLYRTGDRVRQRNDHTFEYLGRRDDQVKIRGFRVELGEIEAALTRHPDVAQAVVLYDGRLIAYIVPARPVDAGALRRHLQASLPEYMVPAAFAMVNELPLTASGKVDRRRLSAAQPLDIASEEHVAPRTVTEQTLAEIWRDVLAINALGITDNFFDLGGHSLMATRVMSRIRARCGVSLPLKRLFELPTVEQLAAAIDTTEAHAADAAIPRIERNGPLPLSFAQERLWFLAQLEGPRATYNMPAALRLTGTLDVDALERALQQIVTRHEILRTKFVNAGQVIDDHATLQIAHVQTRSLEQTIRAAAEAPFDLTRAPLMRATLVRLGENEHVLILVFHHIVADGWSIGILTRELRELYAGRALPPLPIQYADFASWQRALPRHDEHRRYWQQQLAGATATLDIGKVPPSRTFRGGHVPLAFDAARLRERARAIGVTLHVALFSAYATLLYRLSAQHDLIIGTPVGHRPRPELEPLVGLFLNVLPIRVRLDAGATFERLCRDVHATTLDAFAHDELPLEQIVAAAELRAPGPRHAPLFQAMFVLQNTPVEELSLPGVTIEPLPFETTAAKFDVTLSIAERGDGTLAGTLEFAADLFDADAAAELARAYVAILGAVSDDPAIELLRIPLGGEAPVQSFSQDEDFAFGEV